MEITSLNQHRKQLLQELHTLRNYRDYCLNQTHQKFLEIKNDYADKYFTLVGTYANQSFQDRLNVVLHYLAADVQENEDVLGVRLDDLDDEIDLIFQKLSQKEKEFEEIEKQMRKPLKDHPSYKPLFDAFLKEIPDLHNPIDYVELQEIIERKELFDNLLQEIIQQRELQIQQEITKIQQEYLNNRINQKIVYCNLEQHTLTINNTLKTKFQENYEIILKEKEKLFENFKQQELEYHRKYGNKYKKLHEIAEMSEDQEQLEIQQSWKYDLLESQDNILEEERTFREEQRRLDSLLLQYLNRRDQIHNYSSSISSILFHQNRGSSLLGSMNNHHNSLHSHHSSSISGGNK